jgi:hypothetical protein
LANLLRGTLLQKGLDCFQLGLGCQISKPFFCVSHAIFLVEAIQSVVVVIHVAHGLLSLLSLLYPSGGAAGLTVS